MLFILRQIFRIIQFHENENQQQQHLGHIDRRLFEGNQEERVAHNQSIVTNNHIQMEIDLALNVDTIICILVFGGSSSSIIIDIK